MSSEVRTLTKNKISTFIIRIDLEMTSNLDYSAISEKLSLVFPDMQVQIIPHVNVDLDRLSINKVEVKKFLFTIDEGIRFEISPIDKSLIFSSRYYTTNAIYKDRLQQIVRVFTHIAGDGLRARRIGMRFINTFPSAKDNIPSVLNSSEMKILRDSLKNKKDLTRLIMVDEYLKDNYRIRVQYGIPNKFYPNKITSKDVILDIDVYTEGLQSILVWCNMISDFNHAAYKTFLNYIKQETIEELK